MILLAMFFWNEEGIVGNSRGFKSTKQKNLIVISLFSGLSAFGVVLCVVTGGDGNEKDDR